MTKQSAKRAPSKLVKMRHKARIKARRAPHKKFLLHPATVFLLLCTGVLLLSWTLKAHADPSDSTSYGVRAKIPAEPLTEPAPITNPPDGKHFSSSPVDIGGTCPYKSYINLDRNDVFAGTALCTPEGTFAMQVGLLEGANKLQAHVFNITDDEGPLSAPIMVYYDVPKPPPLSPTSASGSSTPLKPAPKPFVISSSYIFIGYRIGQSASWQLSISAGQAPYAFNIKWGDGNESNYVLKESGELSIEHSYDKAGVYEIKISGTDLAGGRAFLQLGAIVTKDGQAAVTGFTTLKPPSLLPAPPADWMRWLWPSYGVLSLMVVSYWLGERTEYLKLVHAAPRRRR